MSLSSTSLKGAKWMGFARVFNQLVQLLVTIVLSRLLMPSEYGLVGMAMVVIGFGNIFVELGLGGAVIHNQESSTRDNSNIFWFNVLAGIILSILIFFSAPLIASFYSNLELIPIVQVLSSTFLITSFGIVPRSLLLKVFNFQVTAIIEIVATFTSGLIGVVLAYNNFGVWALVYSYIALKILQTLITLILARFKPLLVINFKEVKQMLSYGLNWTGFSFINYWARQSDTLLIAKFLSADSLGLYNRAYNLMLMPISQITNVLAQVVFPALASIQNDGERIKKAFLRLQGVIAFICFPLMMGLAAVSDLVTIVVFGEQWAGMITTLRILCFVSLVQALTNSTGWLYTATGKTKKLLKIGIVNTIVTVTLIAIGVFWGSIEKVALCYLLGNLIMLAPHIDWAGKDIGLSFMHVLKKVYASLILSMIMGLLVFGMVHILKNTITDVVLLFIAIGSGIVIYGGLAFVFKLDAFDEIKNMILKNKKI